MRRLMISIVLLLAGIKLIAQPQLTVLPGTPGLSDTVIAESSVTYLVSVQNTGNVVFSDTYDIYVGVLDSGSFIPTTAYIHNVGTTQIVVGATDTQLVSHTIDTTYFKEGNNTVVIWPVSGSSPAVDSLTFDIFVIYFNGIAEESGSLNVKTYPNPAKENLQIVAENGIEQVRIFDLSGRQVMNVRNSSVIPLSTLPPAIYLVEITDKKGMTKRVKIVKE